MSVIVAPNRVPRRELQGALVPQEGIPVGDDLDTDEILALLDDSYAQEILRRTRDEAMSAKELSEA